MASYEFPFNERIRMLLRIEDLFDRAMHHVELPHKLDHQATVLAILQMLDVADRSELKNDLLQELDRQKTAMLNLRGNPAIAEDVLKDVLNKIETTTQDLRADVSKAGGCLRNNEWLMSVKQRATIPGGLCEFDLPAYHFWLGLSASQRQKDLMAWLNKFLPIRKATRIILQALRGTGISSSHVTDNGQFQQMLGGARPAQMVRIQFDDQYACFPEVSANKYAINVRFSELDAFEKPKTYEKEVSFIMTLCVL